MNVPRLNRLLTLEALDKVPDGAGGFDEIWMPLGTMWAEVTLRSGRERAEAGVPVSSVSYRITVRAAPVEALSRPVPGQRFREGARVYPITAVGERDADALYLTCFAEEEIVA